MNEVLFEQDTQSRREVVFEVEMDEASGKSAKVQPVRWATMASQRRLIVEVLSRHAREIQDALAGIRSELGIPASEHVLLSSDYSEFYIDTKKGEETR